jgi:hypothetical protein
MYYIVYIIYILCIYNLHYIYVVYIDICIYIHIHNINGGAAGDASL